MAMRGCGVFAASAVVVAIGGCTGNDARFDNAEDVMSDLPAGLELTPDDGSLTGYVLALESADDMAIGWVQPIGDEPEGCTSAALMAFTPVEGSIEDFGSLVTFAAESAGKDAARFEAVDELDARWWPGNQADCAEAVLAADVGSPFVVAVGSSTTVSELIEHLG